MDTKSELNISLTLKDKKIELLHKSEEFREAAKEIELIDRAFYSPQSENSRIFPELAYHAKKLIDSPHNYISKLNSILASEKGKLAASIIPATIIGAANYLNSNSSIPNLEESIRDSLGMFFASYSSLTFIYFKHR